MHRLLKELESSGESTTPNHVQKTCVQKDRYSNHRPNLQEGPAAQELEQSEENNT
jgi:hypothetical protein